nr:MULTISPECIES: amphi-Trp domain-containing protein [unclassified Methanothrix]
MVMAELTGVPGKIELKFRSGKGVEEFEQKYALTNSETASFLRGLAGEIEAGGEVSVKYGSINISINPEPPIKVEVECEKDELEIEIKLKAKKDKSAPEEAEE